MLTASVGSIPENQARSAQVKALTQMRSVIYSAPDELRTKLEGLSISAFVSTGQGRRASRLGASVRGNLPEE